jgi:hypothetical protein
VDHSHYAVNLPVEEINRVQGPGRCFTFTSCSLRTRASSRPQIFDGYAGDACVSLVESGLRQEVKWRNADRMSGLTDPIHLKGNLGGSAMGRRLSVRRLPGARLIRRTKAGEAPAPL